MLLLAIELEVASTDASPATKTGPIELEVASTELDAIPDENIKLYIHTGNGRTNSMYPILEVDIEHILNTKKYLDYEER